MTPVLAFNAYASAVISLSASAGLSIMRAFAGAWTVVRNRWVAKQLHDLTDYELSDIGLTRADLRDAFHGPIHSDPSLRLAALTHGRPMSLQLARPRGCRGDAFAPPVRGRDA